MTNAVVLCYNNCKSEVCRTLRRLAGMPLMYASLSGRVWPERCVTSRSCVTESRAMMGTHSFNHTIHTTQLLISMTKGEAVTDLGNLVVPLARSERDGLWWLVVGRRERTPARSRSCR